MRRKSERRLILTGFFAAVLILSLVGWTSYREAVQVTQAANAREHSHDVLRAIDEIQARLVDAETGQRGYLLTGDEAYLTPYREAIKNLDQVLAELKNLTSDSLDQQKRIQTLEPLIEQKLAELQKTVDLRREQGLAAATPVVLGGQGKAWMDQIRDVLAQMETEENSLRAIRGSVMREALARISGTVVIGNLVSMLMLLLVFALLLRNLGERKRVQEALTKSEEWFSTTLASVGDAVIATDMNGSVTFLNSAAQSLTGWGQVEARDKSMDLVFDIVNKETRRPVENPVKKVFREGKVVGLADHTLLLSKNGKEYDIEDSAAPILTDTGEELGVVLVFRDITEKKRLDESLRQSQARYHLLFNSNPHPMWVYDLETFAILDVNSSAIRNYGYSREEFLSLTIKDIRPSEDVPAMLESAATAPPDAETTGIWKHCKKGGALIDVEITSHPLVYGGRNGRLVVATDITKRKKAEDALRQSEDRLRSLIDGVRDYAIFMLDSEGRVASWNKGAEHIKGYEAAEIIGKHFSVFYPSEDVEAGKPERELETARTEGRYAEEGWRFRRDGSRFWASVVITALCDKQGRLTGFSKITRDLTDQRHAEERTLLAKEEAERASRFKDQFLSTMSHELRTPLNAILGFSELLTDARYGPLNVRQSRYISHIHTSGKHLLRLISDILDLSKVESGIMEIVPETVAVSSAFAEVLSALHPLADKKSQTLVPRIDPGLHVIADTTRFKQILMNLVGNAIKFTPEGGQIELAARQVNGKVRVDVRDNGLGIPPDEQRRIFEAFYRRAESGKYIEGTGLGLAITERLVQMHDSQLEIESEMGRGTTFYFSLPSVEVPPCPPALPNAVRTRSDKVARILVVEDDAASGHLIESQLATSGYEAIRCAQPQRAAELAAELQPDAITLDLLMKPVHGLEVLLQLKSDPRTSGIPVIVVTIVDQPAVGTALGADDYLVKPVEKATLLAAVDRCLRSRDGVAHKQSILVVEDDSASREMIAALLTAHNHTVTVAVDGAQARASVASALPRLIILDLVLPKMSGFELLAEWRGDPRTAALPVFVLTGKDLTADEEKYIQAHAESLFQKQHPWREELIEQLQRVVNQAPMENA